MSDQILLAHGGGGRLSREIVEAEILPRFGDGPLSGLPDAATLRLGSERIVFSTDSFVVHPLFFPGGNIGELAVYGTVNDLAVSGGRPRWLALSLILEEGLPLATLRAVLDAVAEAARGCAVTVATGDLKVVARGQADGMYITTTGIGELLPGFDLGADRIRPGDHVLVSGPLADHGVAVMSAREGIRIEHGPQSDAAPVHELVFAVEPFAAAVRFMRDPTRGGLAAVLNEVVGGRDIGVRLDERALPFSQGARSVAELLGLDLLHAASEGRVVLLCAPEASEEILAAWRAMPQGRGAVHVGRVTADPARVILETAIGGARLVDMPAGELLPRIC